VKAVSLKSNHFASNAQLERASRNSPPLIQGSAGDGVKLLQQALLDLGFSMPVTTGNGSKSPDGIYGPETFSAVRQFQAQMGLTLDGIAGRETVQSLDSLYIAAERPVPTYP
jgi:peptidoglycan hydrolase-like protein with peptidoglycan-binding domain